MKIAHLNFFPYGVEVGIYNKLKLKSEIALKQNISIKFYIISNYEQKVNANFEIIKVSHSNLLLIKLFRFWVIEQSFDFSSYNTIILRYPSVADFYARTFIRKYGHKIISEHHTLINGEFSSFGRFQDGLKIIFENLNNRYYLQNIKGIVGVTNEIIEEQKKIIKSNKPSFLFSNGGVYQNSIKKNQNNEISLLFSCGQFTPWSGIDRLLKSLDAFDSPQKITIYIIGQLSDIQKESIEKIKEKNKISIVVTGLLRPNQMKEYYLKTDACFGTLALHIKKMKEACPLKTREALSYGKPIIYAYDDPDFSGNEKWNLKLEPNDSMLDLNTIVQFVEDTKKDAALEAEIKQFFTENISWQSKLKNLESFCLT